MADTYLSFDFPTWPLDALDAPHNLGFEPDYFSLSEEELQRCQFPVPTRDAIPAQLLLDSELGSVGVGRQISAKTDNFYHPLTNYAPMTADKFPLYVMTSSDGERELTQMGAPRFQGLYQLPKDPLSLDELLHSTSQVATERALYMNVMPQHQPTPFSPSSLLDSSSSPDTSYSSYVWEQCAPGLNLPDALPPTITNDSDDSLTPLEMPDGSTRFTANWLPVDPEGGFTICLPKKAPINLFDLEWMNHDKETFIAADTGV
ncbi:hypothetical protein EYZ11_006334 [Aspergillus tanneri]|uniref:Uncharacterized protein n=1 Tax=Aspergillus tanneri TaxID=1220188 RepID=A0A4S3JFS4_9EURO|nr:uncharacterized protein ATNIH1004_010480 [Aspergillus tanneri]KAA8643706.1 hypothetical protein ATNIH1004_010480 [Aspergillus tanneri]THC94193.1 hypothetical protein EYZ11_006334 [Aspergillus tanneri]